MAFDSSTLCARTSAGESELATPSQGLSLGQRRVLTLLQNPVAVDELAQRHKLEPEKLARDLTRLAEMRLVVLQGPTIAPQPELPAANQRAKAPPPMAPVVIGRTPRRSSLLPLLGGAVAVVLATGLWFGTRPGESTPEAPVATATADATATAATPAPVAPPASAPGEAPPDAATSAPVTIAPRAALPAPDTRSAGRPASAPVQVAAAAPARAAVPPPAPASAPPSMPMPRPEPAGGAPAAAVSSPTVAAPAAVAPAPVPVAAPVAAPPPPVQVAVAAPAARAAPAAPSAPRILSREAPDFPKEAIADGYKTGIVNARIHVDAQGNVSGVDILGAQPPKVFDRAARRALLRWQFEPNAAGGTADLDVDVKFQRD